MLVCRLMAFFFDLECGELPEWEVCATRLDCSRMVMQLCPVLNGCGSIPGYGNCFELRFFCKVGSKSDCSSILSCQWGRFVCACRPLYMQTSLFDFVLLCSSLGSTAVVVEYSYPMWERLNVSTAKVIDTKNG